MKQFFKFILSLFKSKRDKERDEFVELNKSLLGEDYAKEFWDKYH